MAVCFTGAGSQREWRSLGPQRLSIRHSGSSRCHHLVKGVEQGLDLAWMCLLSTKLWDRAPNLFLEPQLQGNLDLNHHICTPSEFSERLYVIVHQGKGAARGPKEATWCRSSSVYKMQSLRNVPRLCQWMGRDMFWI